MIARSVFFCKINKLLNTVTLELRKVKSDLVLCYKIIFDIVHLNKHDLIYLPLPGAINSKYTSVLTVALSNRISFAKESLTSGIGCPWTVLIFVLFIVFRNSLDAIDDKILVDA